MEATINEPARGFLTCSMAVADIGGQDRYPTKETLGWPTLGITRYGRDKSLEKAIAACAVCRQSSGHEVRYGAAGYTFGTYLLFRYVNLESEISIWPLVGVVISSCNFQPTMKFSVPPFSSYCPFLT